jgi:predicted metal-dependent hydrolase
MNELVSIIVIIVSLLCFFLHYESKYSELTYVTSSIDNKKYLVRNRDDKQQAADLLAKVRQNLDKLADYLKENHQDDIRVQRLIKNYKPEKISESIPKANYTSYSVNKGEKIVFCIRSKDEKEELVSLNTIMFVAIHELAHVITKSIGHTDEFWDNMKFLLKKSVKINIYKKHDYKNNPIPYCGTEITDSPLPFNE